MADLDLAEAAVAPVAEPWPGFDVDDLGDFASEHCSVTLAEQIAGEAESPRGLAGMDD